MLKRRTEVLLETLRLRPLEVDVFVRVVFELRLRLRVVVLLEDQLPVLRVALSRLVDVLEDVVLDHPAHDRHQDQVEDAFEQPVRPSDLRNQVCERVQRPLVRVDLVVDFDFESQEKVVVDFSCVHVVEVAERKELARLGSADAKYVVVEFVVAQSE